MRKSKNPRKPNFNFQKMMKNIKFNEKRKNPQTPKIYEHLENNNKSKESMITRRSMRNKKISEKLKIHETWKAMTTFKSLKIQQSQLLPRSCHGAARYKALT